MAPKYICPECKNSGIRIEVYRYPWGGLDSNYVFCWCPAGEQEERAAYLAYGYTNEEIDRANEIR